MDRFPDSLIAFQRMFPHDDACAAWLASVRWPEGFECPRCGHDHGWALRGKAHTFECARCHRQTSVTAGTILHGSKLALTVWFWAAYLMATHSNGIAALQLQNQLGIGSYRSAWLLAAKLRKAMVDPERDPLSGLIEVDETALAFRTKNDPVAGGAGRSHDGKLLVVGAVEVGDGNAPGRLRLAEIASYGAESLSSATTSPPPAPPRPTAGPATPRPPSRPTIPTSSVPWPPTSCCPGSIRCSPISRAGRAASITGCAPSTCKAISTSSASTGAGHATPPSARCSASPCAPSPSPTTCWSGRKLVHKRFGQTKRHFETRRGKAAHARRNRQGNPKVRSRSCTTKGRHPRSKAPARSYGLDSGLSSVAMTAQGLMLSLAGCRLRR